MDIVLARASLYNFLAAAFGDPPTRELLSACRALLPGLSLGPLEDMQRAYTRLLVGPCAGFVPPYASVYLYPPRHGKPQLWGPEATAVEASYREAGLAIAPGQPRVPDHLALELQFMQHLCAREAEAALHEDAEAAAQWREAQRAFARDHLWPWLPRFVAALDGIRTDAERAYRALAGFALAFVQVELDDPESPPHPPAAIPPEGSGAGRGETD